MSTTRQQRDRLKIFNDLLICNFIIDTLYYLVLPFRLHEKFNGNTYTWLLYFVFMYIAVTCVSSCRFVIHNCYFA